VRVVVLSGGGGGARFARGLQDALAPGELTVVGNVGDDVEVLGLHVSPDLDSLLYALAGLIDEERGWGRAGETWNALASAAAWGGEDWFRLGDLDIGLHLVRTRVLREGARLSEITAAFVERAGLETRILPATDDRLRTRVVTPAGEFSFYFGTRTADPGVMMAQFVLRGTLQPGGAPFPLELRAFLPGLRATLVDTLTARQISGPGTP